jgi:hypothetical protein
MGRGKSAVVCRLLRTGGADAFFACAATPGFESGLRGVFARELERVAIQDDPATAAFLGVLACAHGPLGRDDLIAVAPAELPRGGTIDRTHQSLRQLVLPRRRCVRVRPPWPGRARAGTTAHARRAQSVATGARRLRAAGRRHIAALDSGMAALAAASGGSLCVRTRRLPHDFLALVAQLRALDDVLLVVCADEDDETSPLLVRPAPICLPPLAGRAYELSRVIDEYVRDAVIELNAQDTGVADADRAWIRERAASSLAEIDKAALRLVAIRASRSVSAAAERIGMAPVSLLNWLGRRRRHGRHR